MDIRGTILASGRALSLLCAVGLAMGESGSAAAEDLTAVVLDVRGTCPDTETLNKTLGRRVRVLPSEEASEAWSVRVRRQGRRIRLVLRDPDDKAQIVRSIRSRDCAALAEAVTFIVHRHFEHLNLPMAPAPTPTEDAGSQADSSEADAKPDADAAAAAAEEDPASSSPDSSPDARSTKPPPAEESVPVRWRGGIGAGVVGSVSPLEPSFLLEALMALSVGIGRFGLTFQWMSPTRLRSAEERIRIDQFRPGVELGLVLVSGDVRVIPRFSTRLSVSRVTVQSVPESPSDVRPLPILEAGLGLEKALGRRGWISGNLSFGVLPLRERYLVEPSGPVGRSARGEIRLSLRGGFETKL